MSSCGSNVNASTAMVKGLMFSSFTETATGSGIVLKPSMTGPFLPDPFGVPVPLVLVDFFLPSIVGWVTNWADNFNNNNNNNHNQKDKDTDNN
mmetsp:Transcript_57679/g.103605  ORF Transcript_57679/g.103605 Transcript_57679/m.103605 type:complete len:93 (+) Transcript_57679:1909-2187(+)